MGHAAGPQRGELFTLSPMTTVGTDQMCHDRAERHQKYQCRPGCRDQGRETDRSCGYCATPDRPMALRQQTVRAITGAGGQRRSSRNALLKSRGYDQTHSRVVVLGMAAACLADAGRGSTTDESKHRVRFEVKRREPGNTKTKDDRAADRATVIGGANFPGREVLAARRTSAGGRAQRSPGDTPRAPRSSRSRS